MNYNDGSLEFNPKDLLFYILYRWKPIICGIILFALLLGFFMAYPEYKSSTTPEAIASRQDDLQNYDEQMSLYTRKIDMTRDRIQTLQDYMDTSILMNADPRNLYIAKSTYYVDTNYQILPEYVYQNPNKAETLTWHYQNYLSDCTIYDSLSHRMEIPGKYLMELVTITGINSNTICISVVHPEQAVAKEILTHLDQTLLAYKTILIDTVAEHTLTQMLHTCGNYVSDSLADLQAAEATQLLTLQDELTVQKKELSQFEKNSQPVAANVLSTFIKGSVLGGLAGGVLLVVLFFFAGIFDNRAYSPDHLASHYGIVPLGSILPDGKKFDFITAWLRRQECMITANSQKNYDFLAANVKNHSSNVAHLLVCSDADPDTTNVLISSLQEQLPEIHFQAAGSLHSDAKALKYLPKCDCVLLVLSKTQTRHKHIQKSLALIQEASKNVIGFIYVG